MSHNVNTLSDKKRAKADPIGLQQLYLGNSLAATWIFCPKTVKNGPKNDPTFEKRAPEDPDLDKFVDFLDILSNWA